MEERLVLTETTDGIEILTLNHPEKRNALSREMLTLLRGHLARISHDRSVRAVIIRAEGPVFSSGHDLRELVGGRKEDYASLFALCTEVMEAIAMLPKPVIAEVRGMATAAGCQLAATCDLVLASEEATFATPGVRIGLFCTTPGVALVRAVGAKVAMEMLLTGRPISAREAEKAGLVNRVVPAERLSEVTLVLAHQIITASSDTLARGKRAFYEQIPLPRARAYEAAQKAMVENTLAPDAHEGITAFLEKRPPIWKS